MPSSSRRQYNMMDDNNSQKAAPHGNLSYSYDNASTSEQPTAKEPFPWLHLSSNLFFVMGCILYLVLAVWDFQWSHTLQTLPMYVRVADDDVTWVNYRKEERYNESLLLLSEFDAAAAATSGVAENESSQTQKMRRRLQDDDQSTTTTNTVNGTTTTFIISSDPVVVATTNGDNTTTNATTGNATRQTPEELYYDLWWEQLPLEIRRAYELLGYNKTIWNQGLPTSTDDLGWEELTPQQQAAALFIGYTPETWNAPPPTPDEIYGEEWWGKLPLEIREAYKILGYNKTIWNQGLPVPTDVLCWDDLSFQEKSAALVIGYTIEVWNAGVEGCAIIATNATTTLETNITNNNETISTTENTTFATTTTPATASPTVSTTMMETVAETEASTDTSIMSQTSAPSAIETISQTMATTTADSQSVNVTDGELAEVEDDDFMSNATDNVTDMGEVQWDFDEEDANHSTNTDVEDWNATDPMDGEAVNATIMNATNSENKTNIFWNENNTSELSSYAPDQLLTAGNDTSTSTVNDTEVATTFSNTSLGQSPIGAPIASPIAAPTIMIATIAPSLAPMAFSTPDETLGVSNNGTTGAMVSDVTMAPSTAAIAPDDGALDDDLLLDDDAVLNATNSTPATLYYDEWWADLPPDIQEAYAVLGYTEEAWDNGIPVASEELSWDELTPEQREAAMYIGYTRAIWDGNGDDDDAADDDAVAVGTGPDAATQNPRDDMDGTGESGEAGAPQADDDESEEVTPGYYDDWDWDELPPEVQEAARALGYDKLLWDSGGAADSDELFWSELSLEQQQAAALLGYDQPSWDGTDSTSSGNAATSGVDDDYVSEDDDYVFLVSSRNYWVSRYQIVFFVAAWCFVFVGVLDLIRERHYFHCMMIIAGLCGVVSSMLVESYEQEATIMELISVHFFLLEALSLFGSHKRQDMAGVSEDLLLRSGLRLGDTLFVLGSFTDVVLSYIWLFDDTSDWDSALTGVGVGASVLWLLCPLFYTWATLYSYRHHNHTYDATYQHKSFDADSIGGEDNARYGESKALDEFDANENGVERTDANTRDSPSDGSSAYKFGNTKQQQYAHEISV